MIVSYLKKFFEEELKLKKFFKNRTFDLKIKSAEG